MTNEFKHSSLNSFLMFYPSVLKIKRLPPHKDDSRFKTLRSFLDLLLRNWASAHA